MARRPLGLSMCVALVMGNMIGSGVFMVPAALAPFGYLGIYGWLLTTAGAMVLALLFARLAAMMPRVGGPYAYARAAFGDFIGFQAGWGYWLSIWAGNAAIALALVGYLGVFIPALTQSSLATASAAIAVVWLVTAVNMIGVRGAGWVQVVTTVLKLVPLVAIGFVGIFFIDGAGFTPEPAERSSPLSAVMAAGAVTLWAFLGLESATIPAESVARPARTIPRATIIGVLGAAVVYISGSVAVMGLVPPGQLAVSSAPFADAAGILIGGGGRELIAIGAVIATLGALNGWTLLAGQMPYALARDALLPRLFTRKSAGDVPRAGILFSSAMVTALLLLTAEETLAETFTFIALLATLACLVPYVFCAFAEVLITRRQGRRVQPASVVLGTLGFVYVLWAIAGSGARTVFLGFLMITAGIPFYIWAELRIK